MVAVFVTLKLPQDAVRLYVLVALGVTLMEPLNATLPIPLSMLTEVALTVFQMSVALPVEVAVSGLAAKLAFIVPAGVSTQTDAWSIAVPASPVACAM